MSAIFISHSSSDNAVAGELKARLGEQGHRSVFLDFDPEHGIPAGRDWERELYARLRGCQAMIVLCSEQSMASRWCFAEIAFARSLGKALLPIKIDGCAIPSGFTDVQAIDFRGDREQGYQRLWSGLRQAGLDPAGMFDWDGSRPPYPGLMVFQEQDAAVYFGRGAEIQATIEKLNRMQRLGDVHLAMVLGASGSGKSSLLRAGVMPRLKRDRDRWLVPGPVRPLGQPFERLATVLAAAFKSAGTERPWQEIRDRLGQPPADAAAAYMIDLANDLRVASGQPEATLQLGIDQFEELLTAGEDDADDRFLALVRALVEARSGSIVVIGTLRSDFLGTLQNHAALRGLAYEPIDLPQLSVDAFAEVIEGPARLGGLELEAGLTGAIVADAATDDALPLLAFALRELWEARGADGRLTIDRYRSGLGGLQGSVAKAADGLYPKAFASREEERDVRNAFLAMVRVDAGGAYVRKPARWSDLPASAYSLLEQFVQGRLLVSRGEGTDRILEVAHEALIRRWDKLRAWVEEDREFLRVRERIEGAAARWIEAGRDPSLLLPRGRPLAEAQEILAARRTDLAPESVAFIEASLAAKRAQDEAEQRVQQQLLDAAREREVAAHRLARRTRMAALGIGVLAVLATGFGWYATQQAREADAQRANAEAQRNSAETQRNQALVTQSRFLASLSRQQTDKGNATSGILLALEGLPLGNADPTRPYVPEAEAALFHAVHNHREAFVLRGHTAIVRSASFSADGSRVATASSDDTAALWDTATGKAVIVLRGHEDTVWSVAFSPDGARVVTASSDGTARLWNSGTGQELAVLREHDGVVDLVAFSPDGSRIVTSSSDGTARLWDGTSGEPVAALSGHEKPVRSAAFSADGSRVVTASDDGTVRLWDGAAGTEISVLRGHTESVLSASFSPDGGRVATASADGTARLWDAAAGKEMWVLDEHDDIVRSATFSADGRRVVTASDDGTARLWDAATGRETAVLRGHADHVRSAAFSADGSRVATASDDGTARLWTSDRGKEVATLRGHEDLVRLVAFSPLGKQIVTVSDDGTARLWDARADPELVTLRRHEEVVSDAAWSADGSRVVTTSWDRTARLWDAQTGKELAVLRGHTAELESARFSRTENRLVTASRDGTARVWDANTGAELAELRGHEDSVVLAEFDPSGQHVVTASIDGAARIWDANTGRQLAVLRGQEDRHEDDVESATFSADGQRVVTASDDGTARVWDTRTGRELAVLVGHDREVRSAAFSPDGEHVVTASDDGTSRLWRTATGAEIAMLQGHENRVSWAAFSPDGRCIVTASDDRTARLWDVDTAQERVVLRGHDGEVESAAFSPDGSRVVTASADGTARLWDVGTGKELAVLRGHEDLLESAAFNVDGTRVVTASWDNTARIWRVFPSTEALIAYATGIVPRQLVPEERQRYFLDPMP